jgi:hypothetical protein
MAGITTFGIDLEGMGLVALDTSVKFRDMVVRTGIFFALIFVTSRGLRPIEQWAGRTIMNVGG